MVETRHDCVEKESVFVVDRSARVFQLGNGRDVGVLVLHFSYFGGSFGRRLVSSEVVMVCNGWNLVNTLYHLWLRPRELFVQIWCVDPIPKFRMRGRWSQ
jgi:hypothetical protein